MHGSASWSQWACGGLSTKSIKCVQILSSKMNYRCQCPCELWCLHICSAARARVRTWSRQTSGSSPWPTPPTWAQRAGSYPPPCCHMCEALNQRSRPRPSLRQRERESTRIKGADLAHTQLLREPAMSWLMEASRLKSAPTNLPHLTSTTRC